MIEHHVRAREREHEYRIGALMALCALVAAAAGCAARHEVVSTPRPASAVPLELVVDDDAPAPYRSINDAIRSARPGMTIRVRPGTYRELVELRSGVAIVGAGRAETTIEYARDAAVVIGRDVRGARLEGVRLQHERGEAPCGSPVVLCTRCRDLVIRDSEILGSGYEGVLLNRTSRVRIEGCRIAENSWTGVEVLRSARVEIVECEFVDNPVSLAVAGSAVRVEGSFLGTAFTRAPAVVAALPTHATTLTVVRSEFGSAIVDFTRGGFRQVGLEDVQTGFLQTPVEVREIIAPSAEDLESDDPLDDWMHHALVAWNEPHGLGLGISRHVGYIRRDGSFDDTLPAPPDSIYNGGRPVAVAPATPDASRFVGRWEGGRPDPDEQLELELLAEAGALTGTLTVTSAETHRCPVVVVQPASTTRGPLVSFRCVWEDDADDPIVLDETRCVLTLTRQGALRFDSPSGGATCSWAGVELGRRAAP